MTNFIFKICVMFLEWLGKKTKLTYEEISVMFNLWTQGTILLISAIIPLIIIAIKQIYNPLEVVVAVILFAIYLLLYVWMLRHYRGSMNEIFYKCVDDLQCLAHKYHTTYYIVNIIIFITLWILAVSINLWFSWYIK